MFLGTAGELWAGASRRGYRPQQPCRAASRGEPLAEAEQHYGQVLRILAEFGYRTEARACTLPHQPSKTTPSCCKIRTALNNPQDSFQSNKNTFSLN